MGLLSVPIQITFILFLFGKAPQPSTSTVKGLKSFKTFSTLSAIKSHDALDKEFNKIGFDLDRKFSSHLTIGRMKSAKNKDKIKAKINEMNEFSFDTIEVSEIVLKKSTLTPRGPIYEDLKVFNL